MLIEDKVCLLRDEIIRLKKERNAVIMAHFYQAPEIQEIADFVGDSLELARRAADTNADVIVLCGVHFMAESAAILSPGYGVCTISSYSLSITRSAKFFNFRSGTRRGRCIKKCAQ